MSEAFAEQIEQSHVEVAERLGAGEPILRFSDVHLSFAGVQALAGVSFEVGP